MSDHDQTRSNGTPVSDDDQPTPIDELPDKPSQAEGDDETLSSVDESGES